jgi:uncharacterized membrane protein YhaH (DUF805 family)
MDNIDWGHLLFKFDGRINRGKYWLGIAGIYVITWLLFIIAVGVNSSAIWVLAVLVGIATIWPGLAISIKRWHDRGKSGWWVLIGLIPIIGFWWVLIECGFLEGTPGDNEYGPNPLQA